MSEPAFIGAGVKEGKELWRIENLKPVKLDKVSIFQLSGLFFCLSFPQLNLRLMENSMRATRIFSSSQP